VTKRDFAGAESETYKRNRITLWSWP